jgi:lysophospholipase L1-like esterase
MPVVSRGVPAFGSGDGDPPSWANDADYGTQWRSAAVPAWLAYDLSGVIAAQRGRVVVAWYSNEGSAYDPTLIRGRASRVPRAYVIEANAAPGGVNPPAVGWVALDHATGNSYHSRQHVVDLTDYNWVRVHVTEAGTAGGEGQVRFNLDVHDASRGVEDAWIFYGDSITAGAMNPAPSDSTGTYAELIHTRVPSNFPTQEGGGIPGLRSQDGARLINTWLAIYPGRYVGLAYGTNDAKSGVSPTAFHANYEAMVRAVLAAGKTPVVPKIPWAPDRSVQANAPALNAKLDELYAAYPAIIPGPDFWAYFLERPELISGDAVHPTPAGYAAYRQQWADEIVRRVYRPEPPSLSS